MKFWPDSWQDYPPTINSEMRTILKWKKKIKYSVEFRRKNNINHQLPKTKKECKFMWNFMSGWSEGFEGNGSDIGPRWDGVRSGLKMVMDSLPLFLSRRNNSICTYTGLLIALTNKMIQKQCYRIFKAMTEEIYSFYLLLLESRCFALWAFCFVLCEPTRMFPSSGNPPDDWSSPDNLMQ